jgi:hypothetical protein
MCIANSSHSVPASSDVKSNLEKPFNEKIESCERSESLSSLASSLSSTSSKSSAGLVRFQMVEIREYNIIVGDNPSCSSGPPISLGWEYDQKQQNISLDIYEQHRGGNRRTSCQMKIPASLRRETLREWNISTSEIIKAQTECHALRKQRLQTMKKLQRHANIKKIVRQLFSFTQIIKKGHRKRKV